jgi:hypothetical protein
LLHLKSNSPKYVTLRSLSWNVHIVAQPPVLLWYRRMYC